VIEVKKYCTIEGKIEGILDLEGLKRREFIEF
jgi:hypothetical protein